MPTDSNATVLMFAGQGSVAPDDREQVRSRRPDLLALSEELLGRDPFKALDEGTRFAQAATYCASVAASGAHEDDPSVAFMTGHSMGEISALAAAGALDHFDGLRVVVERGKLMDRHGSDDGAMVALRCDRPRAARLAFRFGLAVANENSPEQIVLSGRESDIERLLDEASQAGVRAKRLAVGGAFHSPAMAPAVQPFLAHLAPVDFRPPRVPVFSGVTTTPFGSAVREDLASALTQPVRWVGVLRELTSRGARRFVDVGPGSTLAGLARKTLFEDDVEVAKEAVRA